jgi:hypothetical protein
VKFINDLYLVPNLRMRGGIYPIHHTQCGPKVIGLNFLKIEDTREMKQLVY